MSALVALAGLFAAFPAPVAAATYRGTLAQPGVVWISDGSRPAEMPESTMSNDHKAFVPPLLVITAGSSVRFPNDDPFFHSIYSESQPDPFDIGFYDTGPGKLVAFPLPGIVNVRCHIHGSMHGTIVVVDGPWAQTNAPGDTYALDGVRPGTHVLHVWNVDAGETTLRVTIAP